MVWSELSFGKYCAYPSDPFVLGIIVTFRSGSPPSRNQEQTAWPDSCTATIRFVFSSCVYFFSSPAITRSAASSKSIFSMNFLFYRAARIAASLHRFMISAPLNPGVSVASRFAISSIERVPSTLSGAKCTRKISLRPSRSGFVTSTYRSNRPGRINAGSSNSLRFVAAMTITFESVENPSISTNSWFNVLARSSPPPPRSINKAHYQKSLRWKCHPDK